MEFLKSLFKNDDRIVGLSSLRKKMGMNEDYTPHFNPQKLVYSTNTKNNFFLL